LALRDENKNTFLQNAILEFKASNLQKCLQYIDINVLQQAMLIPIHAGKWRSLSP